MMFRLPKIDIHFPMPPVRAPRKIKKPSSVRRMFRGFLQDTLKRVGRG